MGYFVTESDDAYSIAMIAFHEAIQAYEADKGNFYAFAGLVIKRRLTDYLRSESRFSRETAVEPTAMSGDVDEDSAQTPMQLEVQKREAALSMQDTQNRPEGTPMRDEIEAVQTILRRYGFSFYDLTECSPKATKTKRLCAEAVRYMLAHPELIHSMQKKLTLPGKELKQGAGVSAKVLERHRRYIIAAVEILNGDYPLLADYMDYIRKGLDT